MIGKPKLPLEETIMAELEDVHQECSNIQTDRAVERCITNIRKHFAALSLEEVKRVLLANDGGVDEAAQALMKLFRKE